MTIRELFEWAVANGVEDIDVQVFDGYGEYADLVAPSVGYVGDEIVEVDLIG